MNSYNISEWNSGIGLMSGTSLDGVDLALCSFRFVNNKWEYTFEKTFTYKYPVEIVKTLEFMPQMKALDFLIADREIGKFFGILISDFIKNNNKNILFVASHGHTIFHEPNKGMTCQIGHGAAIAAECELPVICDFRSSDVAYGGQGAPLVPIGDNLLFSNFDAIVNIGGFSNISYIQSSKRIAYDICPVNIVFNHFAKELGKEFDIDGNFAKDGNCNNELLNSLNSLEYYSKPYPKSLGREWMESVFLPEILKHEKNPTNILSTLAHHAALKIIEACEGKKNILFTGGGCKNKFLISLLKNKLPENIVIPDDTLVEYKEALIFAFMGWLRLNEIPNTIASATGAKKEVSAGCIYIP